jgi:hypothetical protein
MIFRSKGFNEMVGESAARKERATVGTAPRRIRVTQVPRPEEWAALRAWVEEGFRATCIARGASRAPGAE